MTLKSSLKETSCYGEGEDVKINCEKISENSCFSGNNLNQKRKKSFDEDWSQRNIIIDCVTNHEKNIDGKSEKEKQDEIEIESTFLPEIYKQSLRLTVLFWLFLEKFVDICVVFTVTLISIQWKLLYDVIRHVILWSLICFCILSVFFVVFWSRRIWFRCFPRCFLYKLLYILFLISIFSILTVHVSLIVEFLDPYFALVAIGTAGLTYLVFALVAIAHEHIYKGKARGITIWLYGICMPLLVFAGSQPIFLFGGIGEKYHLDSFNFTLNIFVGVLTSLPFSIEAALIYKKYVQANTLETFLNSRVLMPSCVITIYHLQCVMERKKSGNEVNPENVIVIIG